MKRNNISFCEVCGNEVDVQAVQCPYCGVKRRADQRRADKPGFRIVNLEKGMPPAHHALQRMHDEIKIARLQNEQVLIFIHGFGSSGKGGTIRDEVRRQLQYLYERSEINDFLAGENCDRRSGHFRQLVRRFSFLGRLVRRSNSGVTVVIL